MALFGEKKTKEEKQQEQLDKFMEKYQLEDLDEKDLMVLQRIAGDLAGNNLLKAGMALSFAKAEEQAKVTYLSTLAEQNWMVIRLLGRINKNIEEMKAPKQGVFSYTEIEVGGDVNLTQKQEKFVQELIKGKSQREAYRIAYPKSKKWKDNSVDVNASKLLKNAKVSLRYEKLRNKLIKRTEEKAIITAEEIIQGITDIAKDDISNYLNFSMKNVVVGFDNEGPIREDRIVVDIKNSKDINTKNISEVSLGKDGQFKFKLYCKDTALYKLAEIFGLNELNKAKQKLAESRFAEEKNINSKKYWQVDNMLSKIGYIWTIFITIPIIILFILYFRSKRNG